MIAYRIKFKHLISELYLPKDQNGKILLLLPGLPSFLGKNIVTKTMVENGFTVFQPFYSGSFDSGGIFDPQQCLKDVTDFLKMVRQKKHTELYYGKLLSVDAKEIFLFGVSFGSSIAALSCNINNFEKLVLISPVLTYNQKKIESLGMHDFNFNDQMEALLNLLSEGYRYTYRIEDFAPWKLFLTGDALSLDPISHLSNHLQKPLLILHGQSDHSLPCKMTQLLLEKELQKKPYIFKIIKNAGHSINDFGKSEAIKTILDFLNL